MVERGVGPATYPIITREGGGPTVGQQQERRIVDRPVPPVPGHIGEGEEVVLS